MRWVVLSIVLLAGCSTAPPPGVDGPVAKVSVAADDRPDPKQAVNNFVTVVERVGPVVEQTCRAGSARLNCDYQIVVDDRFSLPPNAFQTVDQRGRPIIGFTIALIAEARNQDELAFILGHEAAHHIAGHLQLQQESARRGALLAAAVAVAEGAPDAEVRRAQLIGADIGARTFSKEFELEADALGSLIALNAGYDPLIGIGYFDRQEDPGNVFLGTHPPNAARVAIVRRTVQGAR